MKRNSGDDGPDLTVIETVRCLDCGATYSKPSGGGTVRQNPGCPECGYVGWVSLSVAAEEPPSLIRFGADRLLHRGG